ncbi:DUF397 domain-containing protein [Catellatospora sp. KI3]|uniref:DUF397 domain-containing protein n=1 Tax=Catellatospora sp. KI3 TaxID=3041620 RepID=UPI0024826B1B|nr:DUF397 domain-containing protein [Catellatospora sp. KI3]MDI1460379.1 DUF397 domain-containing protein [Catellatospora sp. KI3]
MSNVDASWADGGRSDAGGGQCVEVLFGADTVAVRDSGNPDGPMLAFSRDSWQSFLDAVKSGDLDLIAQRGDRVSADA